MGELLFGMESEFAVCATLPGGKPAGRDDVARAFAEQGNRLPHLPGFDENGIFLTNGARFYVDAGYHPEMTTPECANPWDVVRYQLAGESRMAQFAQQISMHGLRDVRVFKTNVDHVSGTTWGCHESYLCAREPQQYAHHLLPHLVSRIVYTGAGGLVPHSAGIAFALSPRAWFIVSTLSPSSTDGRPILHTRDEPLNGRHRRLHLICGDNACSQLATWLRFGTTALIVAMSDHGLHPGRDLQLRDPLAAFKRFSGDTTLRARAAQVSGDPLTALQIQRRYLERVEAHAHDAFMPAWAPAVCARWRATLDALAASPAWASRTLDWGIKRMLFDGRVQRHEFSPRLVARWNRTVSRLHAQALRHAPANAELAALGLRRPPDPNEVAARMRELAALANVDVPMLQRFQRLRNELLEIDARFGQLGPDGLFERLERTGELRHHVPGVDNIEHALEHPPQTGRARVRGELVRRLAGSGEHRAGWQHVVQADGQFVDLTDPFTTTESWNEGAGPAWLPNEPLGLRRLRRAMMTADPVTARFLREQQRELLQREMQQHDVQERACPG